MTIETGHNVSASRGPAQATVAARVLVFGELAVLLLVGVVAMAGALITPYRETGEWQFTPTGRDYSAVALASLSGATVLAIVAGLSWINQLAAGLLLLLVALGLLTFGVAGSNANIFILTVNPGVALVASLLAAFPAALLLIGSAPEPE